MRMEPLSLLSSVLSPIRSGTRALAEATGLLAASHDPWVWEREWIAHFDSATLTPDFDKLDYDTNAQPTRLTSISPGALPVLNGNAMRVEVHDSDVASNGCRAEGVRSKLKHRETEGTTVKYRWSTMLDTDFPMKPVITDNNAPSDWSNKPPFQLIAQWHADDVADWFGNSSPPLAITIHDGYFKLDIYTVSQPPGGGDPVQNRLNVDGVNPNGLPIAPITRGKWHHFEITVRWSKTDGWVSVLHWQAGSAKSVAVSAPTLYPLKADKKKAGSAYFKAGLYRGPRRPQGAYQTTDEDPQRTPQPVGTTASGGRIGYILFHDEFSRYVLAGA